MTNREVAAVLERIGQILEIRGENPFKARAYYGAARTIDSLGEEISKVVADGELGELPGFGEALTAKVTQLVTTGHMDYLDEITRDLPDGILELLEVPDVGPKKVKLFYEKLGVKSVDELETAARAGRIAELEGMGEKSQAKILAGIEQRKKHKGRWLLSVALPLARRIFATVEAVKGVRRATLGGSIRRMRETIGDIDILVSARDADSVIAAFTKLDGIERVLAAGGTKASAVFKPGIQVDVRVVEEESYAAAQHYFTGSKEHNVRMRQMAKDHGWKLNEYGLFEGDKMLPSRDEKALYAHFGMDYIPPEMREEMGEVEAALEHRLPKLVELRDVKGVFHMHTTATDGKMTIDELATALKAHGLSYFAVADHSKAVAIVNGLDERRVREQWEEIDRASRRHRGMAILKSIEVDIMKDGTLDYGDELLSGFDCVTASIHSVFTMTADKMTARIVKALSNPYVDIFAHPTGRLLLEREPYAMDVETVLAACAKYDVALEISAHPLRLDLDWRYVKRGKELGCRFAVSLDAHDREDVDYTEFGVAVARKGWLEKSDIINCMTVAELRKWLAARRKKRA